MLLPRQRLLDAARGLLLSPSTFIAANHPPRALKCFPLRAKHVHQAFDVKTPTQFHSVLCQKIRRAQDRVVLASLYIGPAASTAQNQTAGSSTNQYCPERELLDALQEASSKDEVKVTVLLDKHRALRPVPLPQQNGQESSTEKNTISSAEAVYQALHGPDQSRSSINNTLHLCSVLSPTLLQQVLPNPLNEVAGVFHLKAYIVDDSLILSGANLSREYFVDRHDRYLHLQEGGGGLVDTYADIVQALCDHAEVYRHDLTTDKTYSKPTIATRSLSSRDELLKSLTQIMTITVSAEDRKRDNFLEEHDDPVVAVAVPTFQAPKYFFSKNATVGALPFDTEIIFSLLKTAALEAEISRKKLTGTSSSNSKLVIRLSSAYLNPTERMLEVLTSIITTTTTAIGLEFLTAGRTSQGFAPKKKKAGDKGKDWIPTVFEEVAHRAYQRLVSLERVSPSREHNQEQQDENPSDGKSALVDQAYVALRYYNRLGWTFHAKGLWLLEDIEPAVLQKDSTREEAEDATKRTCTKNTSGEDTQYLQRSSFAAVVCGSGNYGARSEALDMESNCILILPRDSMLQQPAALEWDEMINHTTTTNKVDNTLEAYPIPQQQKQHDSKASENSSSTLSWPLRICLPVIRNFL